MGYCDFLATLGGCAALRSQVSLSCGFVLYSLLGLLRFASIPRCINNGYFPPRESISGYFGRPLSFAVSVLYSLSVLLRFASIPRCKNNGYFPPRESTRGKHAGKARGDSILGKHGNRRTARQFLPCRSSYCVRVGTKTLLLIGSSNT